jgi:spore coat protein A
LDPSTLPKFADPLPIPAVAKNTGRKYRIEMRRILAKLHRDLPPTPMWAYGGSVPGPTIETRAGEPVRI